VRLEIVIGRILCGVTNDLVELPQLRVQPEFDKECFDKFIGMADLERLEHDWLAISSDL